MKKQTELEKKFTEYVKTNYRVVSSLWITKQLIKDLAEIAEKENDGDIRLNNDLIKENTKLKKQLAVTKEKIVERLSKFNKWLTPSGIEQIASEILGDDNEK